MNEVEVEFEAARDHGAFSNFAVFLLLLHARHVWSMNRLGRVPNRGFGCGERCMMNFRLLIRWLAFLPQMTAKLADVLWFFFFFLLDGSSERCDSARDLLPFCRPHSAWCPSCFWQKKESARTLFTKATGIHKKTAVLACCWVFFPCSWIWPSARRGQERKSVLGSALLTCTWSLSRLGADCQVKKKKLLVDTAWSSLVLLASSSVVLTRSGHYWSRPCGTVVHHVCQ